MKYIFITFIELIHLLISLFLSVGGYIIPKEYIPIYLLALPYLVIDWNDTDGMCWLTKFRHMIKYEAIDETEKSFLYSIARRYGITMKPNTFRFLLYIILIANWLYAYNRLMNQYKIQLFPNDFTRYIVYFLVLGWLLVTLPSLKNI